MILSGLSESCSFSRTGWGPACSATKHCKYPFPKQRGGSRNPLTALDVLATSCTLPAHAHQKPTFAQSSKSNNFINMGSIEEALEDLRLQEKPNILQTAKKHNVDRTTLSRRWNNVTGSKQAGYDAQRLLTAAQSNSLKKYINDLTERGLPPTNATIRTLAAQIAQRQPGPHWVERWLKANKKDLKPAEEEKPSSSDSSNLVLTAKDWKKVERLLEEAVPDIHDEGVERLNDTIQDLVRTNILLRYKIEGYRRALQNEKKKGQRAKPLFHQLAAQQDGHATFFNPKKVQEARDLQKQQQEGRDHEAALKADEKLQRQLEKEEKTHLIEQRKQQRVQDKEQRERETVAKKAAAQEAKEAKKAERQLQNQLKQAQNGKKDRNNEILAIEEADREAIGGAEGQVAESARRRPRRQKKLPHRYDDSEM